MESPSNQALKLSVIIPTLNEAAIIGSALESLRTLRGIELEIIVVDGGSTDRSAEIALHFADKVLIKPSGRAIQMNLGAKHATGNYLLFLHADTRVPLETLKILRQSFQRQCTWGRFDIRLTGQNPLFRVVEYCVNFRSRLTGIATGDQCIFVRRELFCRMGGYTEIPIMEDIALSKKLKCFAAPVCLRQKITTSSRRWEQRGIFRTILLMWSLRLLYFLGTDPKTLARWY